MSDSGMGNWMENLPQNLWDTPLHDIAIPGSHDSFTFGISTSAELAPDASDGVKAVAAFGKGLIYKWSVTQSLTFSEQLAAGIRYFDLRVATRNGSDRIYFVHSLYGTTVEEGIREILDYLKDHKKEIAILDFNHFYNMDAAAHKVLLDSLLELCGEKLCLFVGSENVNLNMMWENNLQVIILYHHKAVTECCQFWPGQSCIQAPWADTSNRQKLMTFLESTHCSNRGNHFHVAQGVLTPDTGFLLGNLMGNIKNNIAKPFMPTFVDWIKTKERGVKGLNIVIADFVEMNDFCRTVVALNYK